MNDPLLRGPLQGFRDLLRDRERFLDGNGPLRDPIRERRALNQFEHERRRAVGLLQPVNLGNVRVIQRGEDFGLTLEPRQFLPVRRHRRGQHLEGDRSFEVRSVAR